ncbi:hypothetical protein DYB32_003838 [Aphanomyces invadans]|uniref:Cullin family profile domain-containing protein n=1 Tax=Aphanomyces invadans TaxID=157072 RepID=A0A3R6VCJ4_9STRA|nr:hypothetical protein DYB32_003838 [Aphanomyces invadans]
MHTRVGPTRHHNARHVSCSYQALEHLLQLKLDSWSVGLRLESFERSAEVEFEVVWREIEPSVEVLVSGNHDPFSYDKWQSVYRGVYNICTNPGTPQAETLFQHLRDVFVQRVSDIADVSLLSCNIFKKYVERTGLAIVKQFESHDTMRNPEEYIETLACRSFTNAHPSLPELLAKYTHVLMTKSKYSTDDGMEKRVESVGVVFCLLDDKDVFKTMYSTLLAKRLIQGMARLVSIAKSTNTSYKAWKEKNHRERGSPVVATIDVAIDVLTAGAWPIPTPAQKDLTLPAVWFDELELFAKFYGTQSNGRRLHWVHHMSHGIVRVAVAGRRFDLHATYHQMALLLLVKLFALCLNETSDVHAYSFNTAFTSKRSHLTVRKSFRRRSYPRHDISLGQVLPKYTQLSRPKAKSAAPSREVVEDRKMTMQAAIVRIMKSRRELSFATLLSETTHMLAMQFVPTQAFLQQNLDVLVDKEYIRVAAQGTATMPDAARAHAAVYVYVA